MTGVWNEHTVQSTSEYDCIALPSSVQMRWGELRWDKLVRPERSLTPALAVAAAAAAAIDSCDVVINGEMMMLADDGTWRRKAANFTDWLTHCTGYWRCVIQSHSSPGEITDVMIEWVLLDEIVYTVCVLFCFSLLIMIVILGLFNQCQKQQPTRLASQRLYDTDDVVNYITWASIKSTNADGPRDAVTPNCQSRCVQNDAEYGQQVTVVVDCWQHLTLLRLPSSPMVVNTDRWRLFEHIHTVSVSSMVLYRRMCDQQRSTVRKRALLTTLQDVGEFRC